MAGSNTFLSRALASDPLMTMSLLPRNARLDQTNLKLTSRPQPSPQLEDIIKPTGNSESIAASPLEPDGSDLDLPSSVFEEIEVCP
jgi:hypothetical protein